MPKDKPVLVYSTFPGPADAERIGALLVEEHLAACVNIVPGMTAIYRWEGRINRDSECVMIIKSRAGLADAVIARVRGLHPYSNPALVVIEPVGGAAAFLDWIVAETGGGGA